MPRVRWGISGKSIDDFDRSTQFTPYTGPIPPSAVYQWQIKTLKSVAPTKEKLPQLRVGLELVPRRSSEERYAGYFIVAFLNIGPKNEFTYVPFLDAIGVSGDDFENRTIADAEGKVQKIGKWRNTGEEQILAQLADGTDQHGKPRKEIKWFGPLTEEDYDDDETDDDEEYDEEDEEYDDDDEEPF